jgi:hypothetical protein
MTTRFWADGAEPKRKFRFLLSVSKQGVPTIEKWLITKVTRPSFQVSGNPIKYLNHTFNFPGTVEWQDVSFTLVDIEEPSANLRDGSSTIMEMLSRSGYRVPGTEATKQLSKEDAIINLSISTIDSGKVPNKFFPSNTAPEIIDEWTLYNAWISQATFGDFDYTSDEAVSIDVTVKYDYAKYKAHGLTFPKG